MRSPWPVAFGAVARRDPFRVAPRADEPGALLGHRQEGTPQGGPLSRLLANVLLDEVVRELEKRGHAFVRRADDCNVWVRSRRAGERVHGGLKKLYADLELEVNEDRSAVDDATKRDLLGCGVWVAAGDRVCRRVAGKALGAMEDGVREITRRNAEHRPARPHLRRAGGPPARPVTSTVRTAGCGPARPVVWEGSGGHLPPPPIPIEPARLGASGVR